MKGPTNRSAEPLSEGAATDRQQSRRGFLKRLGGAAAGVLAWRARHGPMVGAASPLAPSTLLVRRALPSTAQSFPQPTYVPSAYKLTEIYHNRPDGFGEGSDEVAFFFADRTDPLGFNNPLAVYVARQPQHTALACTENRQGDQLNLPLASGETVQARYHDGLWAGQGGDGSPVWEGHNVHSLTFNAGEFTVGVRGSRVVGVDREKLTRVASSIA